MTRVTENRMFLAFFAAAVAACPLATTIVGQAAPPPLPKSYALIISGVSGDKQHYDKFWDCASSLYKALRERCGYSDEEIVLLFEEKGGGASVVDDVSTRARIVAAFEDLGRRMAKEDRLFVFCVGHANRHGNEIRYNLKGPDLTLQDLAGLLDKIPNDNIFFVLSTPLSGYFIRHASKPGRIVLTATDALPQLSETAFPYLFVRGFYDETADANRDGFLSALELFNYTKEKVEEFFKEKELIPTEYPMLDDTGNGRGEREPDPEKGPAGKRAAEEGFALQAEE